MFKGHKTSSQGSFLLVLLTQFFQRKDWELTGCKKSNIERYVERPNATLCTGKYIMIYNNVNDFCYTECFSVLHT